MGNDSVEYKYSKTRPNEAIRIPKNSWIDFAQPALEPRPSGRGPALRRKESDEIAGTGPFCCWLVGRLDPGNRLAAHRDDQLFAARRALEKLVEANLRGAEFELLSHNYINP